MVNQSLSLERSIGGMVKKLNAPASFGDAPKIKGARQRPHRRALAALELASHALENTTGLWISNGRIQWLVHMHGVSSVLTRNLKFMDNN
jgi:hypothetical protein